MLPTAPVATACDIACFVEREGFAVLEDVVVGQTITSLRQAIAALPEDTAVRRQSNVFGVRNLLDVCPAVCELARSEAVRAVASAVLGRDCFAVRATFFDKVAGANWNLRWHQDGVISVRERIETPGFTAWANKAGVWQVRPPAEVLASMLAIRVHLDDCPRDNGPLRVLSGSHKELLTRDQIIASKHEYEERVCEVNTGGIVAMRPLLLHASSAAEAPRNRRVVHLEFAAAELPGALDWASRVA